MALFLLQRQWRWTRCHARDMQQAAWQLIQSPVKMNELIHSPMKMQKLFILPEGTGEQLIQSPEKRRQLMLSPMKMERFSVPQDTGPNQTPQPLDRCCRWQTAAARCRF